MKARITIPLLILLLPALFTFQACDRDPVPPPEPVVERISVADLRGLYSGAVTVVDTNVYVQGIITLTPEMGNIPEFIAYLQDETGGIALTVTGTNSFAMGSEVKIKCRGIELSVYRGLMQFGNVDIATSVEVVTLSGQLPAPKKVRLSEILEGKHQAQYVKVDTTEFNTTGTFSGSKVLTDCSYSVTVHTRSESLFASQEMPAGNGTFYGVVSVYDSPQLIIRDPAELAMTNEKRCNIPKYEWLKETFESLADNSPITNLTGWKSIAQTGTRTWLAGYYSSDTKFADVTAYGSGQPEVVAWMITPQVDITDSSDPILTFRSKGAYDNGATLQTLVSTDYDGGAQPWNFTWTVLPATYPSVPTNGYGNWASSGDLSLLAYKTTLYIAFRYSGNDPATGDKNTTTWQVDDIRIGER
ncbi:MAG: choice-of-anchor J domain-containing protein [Bacteroidales bacterium]|nr:choice-of-anchor J domain-containing protein [Bacteroidales bacterium]